MKKILMFSVRNEEKPYIEEWQKKNNVQVDTCEEILTIKNVDKLVGYDGVSIQQTGTIDDELYSVLNRYDIKQIAQRSAGYDMYDLKKASDNGLIITNVPNYSPNSIAEYAVTVSLNLVRKIKDIEERVAHYNFSWDPKIISKSIDTLTVAVIGTGRIGESVAKIFNGFGAKVIGYDLYPSKTAEKYLEYKNSLDEVIKRADIISLHMPATDDNYHLFNYSMFEKMKKDAIFVNAARGSLVDTVDLIKAIDDEIIQSAAIDTYENESLYFAKNRSDSKLDDSLLQELIEHPKIIVTPHIAFYTETSIKNLVESSLYSVLEVLNTGDAKYKVN